MYTYIYLNMSICIHACQGQIRMGADTCLGQEGRGEASLAAGDEGGVVAGGGIAVQLDNVVRRTHTPKLREGHLERASLA